MRTAPLFTLSVVMMMMMRAMGSVVDDEEMMVDDLMEEEELERQGTPCACYNPLPGTARAALSVPRLMEELERQGTPCACYNPLAGTARAAQGVPKLLCTRNPRACFVRCNSRCPGIKRIGNLCRSAAACRM